MAGAFVIMKIFDFMTKRPGVAGETRGMSHVHSSCTAVKEGEFWELSADAGRINDLLNGFYGHSNFLTLGSCIPEVAAPVHEIASRVASSTFQLCKEWNDEVDYSSDIYRRFSELFDSPNPREGTLYRLIYASVVYEILTGRTFFYKNVPTALRDLDMGEFKSISTWWVWPSPSVVMKQRRQVNIYNATTVNDFIESYQVPVGLDRYEVYTPDEVCAIINGDLECLNSVSVGVPFIKGAEKAIRNLIPVYEARGVIFIKRGAMGFFVSKKTDESGTQPLTKSEKERVNKDFNETYGITGGRNTIGVTDVPIEFVRTAMSIQELQPFDETLADAAAIYAVLRVPPHLIPSKDKSTYANASTDMRSFYTDVINPWAEKYAKAWTKFLGLDKERRYIKVDNSNVIWLQENKKEKSDVDFKNGQTYLTAFLNGAATLGEWVVARGGTIPSEQKEFYNKTLFQMTPEEREVVRAVLNIKKDVTQSTSPDSGNTQTA